MAVVRMAVLHPGHTLGDNKPLLRAGLVRNFVEVLLRLIGRRYRSFVVVKNMFADDACLYKHIVPRRVDVVRMIP